MKISLLNYSNSDYNTKKKINSFSGKLFGNFNEIYSYSPSDIDDEFKIKNNKILSQNKGAGLWLWKPYFFCKVLKNNIDEDDYLFYCDAASFFIRSVKPLVRSMEKSNKKIMCFSLPLTEKQWTDNQLFNYFKATEEMKNSNQILASFLLVKKSKETLRFAEDWLNLCSNESLILGDNSNYLYNKNHRFDQSILSLLCKRNNILPFRDPSQYGVFPEMYANKGNINEFIIHESSYKTTIIQIRKSNFIVDYFKYIVKSFLKSIFPKIYNKVIKK